VWALGNEDKQRSSDASRIVVNSEGEREQNGLGRLIPNLKAA